ncbi:hypothetical protein Psfp_03894 [Pelotomaculum sp. FP]|uniref:hypothetical protein n=1 Tax=Pelotomaculum sp. FP TaxID=261474 RepID=UPI001066989E|nr:hypothetical protein [Pelotomaculum sp. FP]TEB11765.1 hypothetical protein Psfp_03894 [Pelotomaculum sp. FP]
MSNKIIDITGKYGREIKDIRHKLTQLKNGRIYDLSGVQGDGYLSTNINQLKEMLTELIYKIEYGKDSDNDKLSDLFK